jgi:hypothetical protein
MRSTPARLSAVVLVLLTCVAADGAAQSADSNRGKITLVGGLDFANAYMFRGLRRDDTRVILWPYAEAAADLHSSTDGLTRVTFHIGTWNSLHTGEAGLNSTSGKMWYQSDIYGTIGIGFDPGISVAATYTAYTSPNNSFTTIKELSFKAALDEGDVAGMALQPYALIAFELDTLPGVRQADRGVNGGTYLEAGIVPTWNDPSARVQFPIKVGLSLNDYYELAGVDHKFGYLSLAAVATVPLGRTGAYGGWNVHGGVEFQSLGDTPEAFNGGDQSKLIASIGIGLRY